MPSLPKPSRKTREEYALFDGRTIKARKRVRRVKRTRAGQPSMKTLDDLARARCHARGACEAAGWRGTTCKGVLQWAHIVERERTRNNLRWRADNCFLLCAGHHWRWSRKNHAEWHLFLREKIGEEKWHALEREALYGEKADRVAMLAVLTRGET